MPSGRILKAARALAGLKSAELAKLAGVDPTTISRLESTGGRPVKGYASTIETVRQVLKEHGVEYDERGVYLIKKVNKK